jgi:fibronectin type 3 domain-containing protein
MLKNMRTLQVGSRAALLLWCLCLFVLSCKSQHEHSVTLRWQPPAPVAGVVVLGYEVYRSTAPGGQYERIADRVHGTQYEDKHVEPGKTYYYVVTAFDQAGRESTFSAELKALVPE